MGVLLQKQSCLDSRLSPYSMASKVPKLVLPAYDLKTHMATYRHYAEAVFKANPGMRGTITKDFVDKAWVTAVKEHWPGNKGKQEVMFRRVRTLPSFLSTLWHCMTCTLGFVGQDDRVLGPEEARRRVFFMEFGSLPWNKDPGSSSDQRNERIIAEL